MPSNVVSLERALSKLGAASRSQARQLIAVGRVGVNGRVVRDAALRVRLGQDAITVDGRRLEPAAKVYLAANKPRGLVTTASDEEGRPTVYQCLRGLAVPWVGPVGRLDKASEGLLLFTNDTAWADRILDPASHLPRVYHVQVSRHLPDAELAALRAGVALDDGELARAARATVLRAGRVACWLEIVLHEGRNRQIRRMLDALGIGVLRLVRVAIGPLQLGDLPTGQARHLTSDELRALAAALHNRASPAKRSRQQL